MGHAVAQGSTFASTGAFLNGDCLDQMAALHIGNIGIALYGEHDAIAFR